MTEKLLQYIWQFQYFNRNDLQTTEGEALQILFQGGLNKNQGPDFSGAKIKIGSTTLAGTIELHCKTSDWEKHQHSDDNNYNNVILHVVYQHDKTSINNIAVLELQPRISAFMLDRYHHLMNTTEAIACSKSINSIKDIIWIAWKERLLAERLTRKASRVLDLVNESNGHWEEVFWWLLARSFGTTVNADAFESLARTVSINILAKHKNSIHQLEALLLGQAKLLEGEFEEEYPKLLQREFRFLKAKHKLQTVSVPVHFLRMRPVNFPTVRLAQLAMLVHLSNHLFSKIKEENDLAKVRDWLKVTANDYWHYHYSFSQLSGFRPKQVGNVMIDSIVINTIVPTLFAYGLWHKDEVFKEKALMWLEETPAETNHILTGYKKLAISNNSAYDSQALLQLKNEYCNKKRCLECSVGNYLIKTADA